MYKIGGITMKKASTLLIALFLVLILLAGGLFYEKVRIPEKLLNKELEVRKEIDLKYFDTKVVARLKLPEVPGKTDKVIEKNMIIDEKFISQNIVFEAIPSIYAPKYPISSKTELIGKFALTKIVEGSYISRDMIGKRESVFNDYSRIKEYYIDSYYSGKIVPGVLVDVNIKYGNGDYDVMLPKVEIKDIKVSKDMQGNVIKNGDKSPFKIYVAIRNEIDARDMCLADQLGTFSLRIYEDIDQLPSLKTFDYEKMLEKQQLNELIVSEKKVEDNDKILETTIEDGNDN